MKTKLIKTIFIIIALCSHGQHLVLFLNGTRNMVKVRRKTFVASSLTIKQININSLHLAWKYARFLSARTLSVPRSEQSLSLSMFLPQMEAIVFIILQIFFATHTVLKIGEYSWICPCFSWGIFGHEINVTRLAQSCTSRNIWWIINKQ